MKRVSAITVEILDVQISGARAEYNRVKLLRSKGYGTKQYKAVIKQSPNFAKHHPFAVIVLFLQHLGETREDIIFRLGIPAADYDYIVKDLDQPQHRTWVMDMRARFHAATIPETPKRPYEPKKESADNTSTKPKKEVKKAKTPKKTTTKKAPTKKSKAKTTKRTPKKAPAKIKATRKVQSRTTKRKSKEEIQDILKEVMENKVQEALNSITELQSPKEKKKGIISKVKGFFGF